MKKMAIMIVAILSCALFIQSSQFTAYASVEEDGYIVDSETLVKNLQSEELKYEDRTVTANRVNAYDEIFKKGSRYFIGAEKKQEMQLNFPNYNLDGTSLTMLSNEGKLVDSSYILKESYANLKISNGICYYANTLERSEVKQYVFYQLKSQFYINLMPMVLTTSTKTYQVPMNSVIYMDEENFNFYSLKDGEFKYTKIRGVDLTMSVLLNEETLTYEELMTRLGEYVKPVKKSEDIVSLVEESEPEKAIFNEAPSIIEDKKDTMFAPSEPNFGNTIITDETTPEDVDGDGELWQGDVPYVKPAIKFGEEETSVYALMGKLQIYDPAGVITDFPTFHIKVDGKLYLRSSFASSGDITINYLKPNTTYEIVGDFTYLTEKNEEVTENFYQGMVTTKDINSLGNIDLSFENGDIFSDHLAFKNFQVISNIESEAIVNIKKMFIVTTDGEYTVSSNALKKIKNGELVDFTTPYSLLSNTEYSYYFKMVDRYGNAFNLTGNEGNSRTCRLTPSASFKTIVNQVANVVIDVKLTNKDKIAIENYKMIVVDNQGNLIEDKEIPKNGQMKISNLNASRVYTVRIEGDYDINDGKGVQKGQMLGKGNISTSSLGTLGSYYLNTSIGDITSDSANIKVSANLNSTNAILLELLQSIKIDIYNTSVGDKTNHPIVDSIVIEKENIDLLKEGKEVSFLAKDIPGSATFTMKASSIVKQGQETYEKVVLVKLSNTDFKTRKTPAEVLIKNQFVTESSIEFDTMIVDNPQSATVDKDGNIVNPNATVLKHEVILYVRNSDGTLIYGEDLKTNQEYKSVSITRNLQENARYTVQFMARDYNEGHDNSTFESNKIIYSTEIVTKEGISGSLALQDLKVAGTNQYNANIKINVSDKRNEIATNKFHVDMYLKTKKGNQLLKQYEYNLDDDNTYDKVNTYSCTQAQEYYFEIYVTVRGKTYVLDTLTFNTEEEIYAITNSQELYNVRLNPSRKYIVLNDINYDKAIYPLGARFSGKIDFQGYKLNWNVTDAAYRLTAYIEASAEIKNLHYVIDNSAKLNRTSYTGYITYYNYGLVDNLFIEFNNGNQLDNLYFGLVAETNFGTVSNFVVKYNKSISVERQFGSICASNFGTVKNGYVYGENIDATLANTSTSKDSKSVGGVVGINQGAGVVSNVYSLLNVNTILDTSKDNQNVANIIGLNNGVATNTFSIGNSKNGVETYGPSIGKTINGVVRNNYYVSDITYRNEMPDPSTSTMMLLANLKVAKRALHEKEFYASSVNSNDSFNVDNLVPYGYYPQVKMNACMPEQEWQVLPDIALEPELEIVNTEILETDGETATVKVMINNPGAYNITKIQINNVSNRIVSQFDEYGKSYVTIAISNPSVYKSNYSINYFNYRLNYGNGKTGTVTYEENECMLALDLYRTIDSIKTWGVMNERPTENYRLKKDLDFGDEIKGNILITKELYGKFDGAGHTISNLNVGNDGGVFVAVRNTFANLFVTDFVSTSTTKAGFILTARSSASIQNVHITNANVTGTEYVGVLTGYCQADIIDSSVSDSKIEYSNNGAYSAYVGALAGTLIDKTLTNSYGQNNDIALREAFLVAGVGGLVGTATNSTITKCYATGTIYNKNYNTGGIVGRVGAIVSMSDVYSDVKINSSGINTGGVVGVISGSNISFSGSLLALGDIYSRVIDTSTLNRNIGTLANYSFPDKSYELYYYESQLVNGFDGNSDTSTNPALNGTKVDYATLSTEAFYDSLKWTDTFDVEDPKITNGILPKLYSRDGTRVLPNQKDHAIVSNDITIKDITTSMDDANNNIGSIVITFNRLKDISIKNVDVTNLNVSYMNVVDDPVNNISQLRMTVTPKEYFDSYPLNYITYTKGEDTTVRKFDILSKVNIPFYKNIYSVEDWNTISAEGYSNYRLMNDIDFSGRFFATNVKIGSLVSAGDDIYTLKNMNATLTSIDGGIITDLSDRISRVNFENITITNNESGYRLGIIGTLTGNMTDCNFKNITINSKGIRVGVIGTLTGNVTNVNVDNIQLSDKTSSTGNRFYGAIAGLSTEISRLSNIKVSNVTINSVGAFVGGIVGDMQGYLNNCHVTNPKLNGRSYVGGITGRVLTGASCNNVSVTADALGDYVIKGTYAYVGGIVGYVYTPMANAHASNLIIKGNIYVGGVLGVRANGYTIEKLSLENSKIYALTGPGAPSYIGGIVGSNTHNIRTLAVSNCEINVPDPGTTGVKANYVGGIAGYSSYTMTDLVVSNTNIGGGGSYVGGIAGRQTYADISNIVVQNANISGEKYVGGIVGGLINDGAARDGYVTNVTVKATNDYAGGAIGLWELCNANAQLTSAGVYRLFINATVESNNFAGAVMGGNNQTMKNGKLMNDMMKCYSLVNVTNVTGANTHINLGVGTSIDLTNQIRNLISFPSNTFNGVKYTPVAHGGALAQQSKFALSTYYSNAITHATAPGLGLNPTSLWTWKTSGASYANDGYFPYVRSAITSGYPKLTGYLGNSKTTIQQNGIVIPSFTASTKAARSAFDLQNHELPEVQMYTSNSNSINLEFSKVDPWTEYKITSKDNVIHQGVVSQRVYTFDYDFKTSFTLTLTDGKEEKVLEYTPNMFVRYVMTYKNHDAYIASEGIRYDQQWIEGNYIHIYNGQAVSFDGKIIDLETQTQIGEVKEMQLSQEVHPLYHFDYQEGMIDTYGSFSVVGGKVKEMQMYVYNNQLSLVDGKGDFVKDSVINDSYGDHEYLVVLGNDGSLHNVKDSIKLPKDFENSDITYMTSNITCDNGHVFVQYQDGSLVGFNYRTGEYIDKQIVQNSTSLLDYFILSFNSLFDTETTSLPSKVSEVYQEVSVLEKQLEVNPIANDTTSVEQEEVENAKQGTDGKKQSENDEYTGTVDANVISPDSSLLVDSSQEATSTQSVPQNYKGPKVQGNSYVAFYDTTSNKYLLYQQSDLFEVEDLKDLQSENEKIEELSSGTDFYSLPATSVVDKNQANGIVLFAGSSGLIFVALTVVYYKRKKILVNKENTNDLVS